MASVEELLLDAASKLTKDTPSSEIDSLLRRLAGERLNLIAKRRVLNEIKRRTEYPVSELRGQLAVHDRALPERRGPRWTEQLGKNERGEPIPDARNVEIALRNDRAWHGVLWLDEFRQKQWLRAAPPWANGHWRPGPLTDADRDRIMIWMQSAGIHIKGVEPVRQALRVVTDDMRFHPVREFLTSEPWDHKQRADRMLETYFGVKASPYVRAIGVRWLISGVARVMQPGCKADCCLVLEGLTNLGKSKAARIIGDPLEDGWFTDQIAALGTKDASEQTIGIWVVELAEFDAVKKAAEVAAVKAFMSRQQERFRWSYGEYVQDFARQCIFIATTEEDDWNHDPLGARRFWPARCTHIAADLLAQDCRQLWAEAYYRYTKHERHWLHEDDLVAAATVEQSDRYETDAWETIVMEYTGVLENVSISEILTSDGGLAIRKGDISRAHQMRVGDILRRNRWTKYRAGRGDRETRYRCPEK